MRGKIKKHEIQSLIRFERSLLNSRYIIELNKELCNGCGICAEVCPKEAISQSPAVVKNGVLIKKPTISFDTKNCIFCGECVVLCPLDALTMKIDGKKISTVEKNKAFPSLIKSSKVLKEKILVYDSDFLGDLVKKTYTIELFKCNPDCQLICEKECPTKAIKVSYEKSENDQIKKIIDLDIDESKCFYCKRCEVACPFDAIKVQKPFLGTLELNVALCPKDCTACQDICPSQAIRREDGKLVVSEQFCVFCSACQKICPEKAITVKRDKIFHSDIRAATWLTALRKVTGYEAVRKEVMAKAGQRRTNMVERRKRHVI